MDVIDEKIDRIAKDKTPLRLQIVDARGCPIGTCGCGKELAGFYGILCIGGESPEDPLLIFNWLCRDCVGDGPQGYVDKLEVCIGSWKQASERTSLLIESVLSMPLEDWPVIEPDQEEVT